MSHARTSVLLAALVTAAYAYLLTRVNLPEEWGYWIGGGFLIGLALGNWPALLAALAPLVFIFTSPASGSVQDEVNAWVVLYYVPGAFLVILLGLLTRVAIRALTSSASKQQPCD